MILWRGTYRALKETRFGKRINKRKPVINKILKGYPEETVFK